jgi:2-oxoglutarate dehydrogenase E2 component (dihydrolipoamide succinyltransferase)
MTQPWCHITKLCFPGPGVTHDATLVSLTCQLQKEAPAAKPAPAKAPSPAPKPAPAPTGGAPNRTETRVKMTRSELVTLAAYGPQGFGPPYVCEGSGKRGCGGSDTEGPSGPHVVVPRVEGVESAQSGQPVVISDHGVFGACRMRLRIAERLKAAQNTAAMLTTFQEVDMGNLMELRNAYKEVGDSCLHHSI